MACFRDTTYCSASCRVLSCVRNLTPKRKAEAVDSGLPIAMAHFWMDCPGFDYDVEPNSTWYPIAIAPKKIKIAVYCPPYEDLDELVSVCQWHPDAGFCVDEVRQPTLWTYLPVNKS